MARLVAPARSVNGSPPASVPYVQALSLDRAHGRVLVFTYSRARAFRIEDGAEDLRFEDHGLSRFGHELAHARDADRVVSLADRHLLCWETERGALVSRATLAEDAWLEGVSPDAQTVITATADTPIRARMMIENARVHLRETATGAIIRTLMDGGHIPASRRSAAFLPGNRAVIVARDGRLRVFDLSSGALLAEHAPLPPPPRAPSGSFGSTLEMNFMGASDVLTLDEGRVSLVRYFSGSEARDLATGERRWFLHSGASSTAVDGPGKTVLSRDGSASGRGEAFIDIATGAAEPVTGYGPIDWGCVDYDGGLIACSDDHGNVRVLSRPMKPQSLVPPGSAFTAAPTALAIGVGGRVLVGCRDGSMRLVDGETIRPLPWHGSNSVVVAGALPDGRFFTATAESFRIWSADGRIERELVLANYTDPIASVGGRFVISARESGSTVRRASDMAIERESVLRRTPVRDSLALLDDGRTLFGADDLGVARFDLETGEATATLAGDAVPELSLASAFTAPSSDGRSVLLGTWTGPLVLWLPETGATHVIPGLDGVRRLLVSGKHGIAVAGAVGESDAMEPDTRIRLVDLERRVYVADLVGHEATITCLALSGDLLVSAGEDRRICFWRLPAG